MGVMQINPAVAEEMFVTDRNGKKSFDEGAFAEHLVTTSGLICSDGHLYSRTGEVISRQKCEQEIYEILRGLGMTQNLAARVKSLYEVIKIQAFVEHIETPLNQIAVQNGTITVDLQTGEFRFTEEMMFSRQRLNCKFDPTKPVKPPKRFFEWVEGLIHDYDRDGFQEFCGYLLIPCTKLQKAMILLGRGQEGKSRIGLILHYLFGAACVSSSLGYFEENQYSMPRAQNRLVLFQDDLKKDKLKSTETFKMMVSAEIPVQAEEKHERAYSFQPFARWVICSNAPLAALYDNGHGFYRRLYMIRVKNRPEDRVDDAFYFEPMMNEMDGIFIWMLQGLQRLIQNKWQLSISAESKALVEEQQEGENSLVPFMRERLSFGRGYSITTEKLYQSYVNFCAENQLYPRKKGDLKTFFDEQLDNLKIKVNKHLGDNRGQTGYSGMTLKATASVLDMLNSGGDDK